MGDIALPKLHAGQREIAKAMHAHPRVVVRAGRRFGKTLALEREAALCALRGGACGWFGPQYRLNAPSFARLRRLLAPAVRQSDKVSQRIELVNGGAVEFWTLQDENAGRSRHYRLAILDEASLADGLRETFEQSIVPTLLDDNGSAVMAGTPKGVDADSYFYLTCTDPALGWHEVYAPTSANPFLDPAAVARLEAENPPLVYAQEFQAQFVEWSGVSLFHEADLLENGQPAELPARIDVVYAVIDTAAKAGSDHDASAVLYIGANSLVEERLYLLDYDIRRIDGAWLIDWLPGVTKTLEGFAESCHARRGSVGLFIEDASSGTILLQQCYRQGIHATALDSKLTAQGKDGRALAASAAVHQHKVAITRPCLDRIVTYDGRARNWLLQEVTSFVVGQRNPHQLDLLDCFTYAVLAGIGS